MADIVVIIIVRGVLLLKLKIGHELLNIDLVCSALTEVMIITILSEREGLLSV